MTSALAQGKAMATGGGLSELRSRLLFVLLAIVVYRIGSHIPVPGIDPERLRLLFNQNQGGILDLVNMFGGGALERMSIFALGIMPYISASIITQLAGSDNAVPAAVAERGRSRSEENSAVHAVWDPGAGARAGHGDEQWAGVAGAVLYR